MVSINREYQQAVEMMMMMASNGSQFSGQVKHIHSHAAEMELEVSQLLANLRSVQRRTPKVSRFKILHFFWTLVLGCS